jgi:hypothetical protein
LAFLSSALARDRVDVLLEEVEAHGVGGWQLKRMSSYRMTKYKILYFKDLKSGKLGLHEEPSTVLIGVTKVRNQGQD